MSKPKILRFWDGPKRMPVKYEQYGAMWQALNPGWEVVDYNQQDIVDSGILERPMYADISKVLEHLHVRDAGRNGIELWVQSADVLGYVLAYEFGGVYVNADIMPVKPLRYLLSYYQVDQNAYVGREDPHNIVNAVLGGPPKHPLYAEILKQLPGRYFANPTAEMVLTTGPALLTSVIHSGVFGREVTVLPEAAFSIIHWGKIDGSSVEQVLNQVDFGDPRLIGCHLWNHKFDKRSNCVETATQ